MAEVLGDERLHEFIGGHPPTLAELRERYRRLAEGSPDRTLSGSTGSSAAARMRSRSAPFRRP